MQLNKRHGEVTSRTFSAAEEATFRRWNAAVETERQRTNDQVEAVCAASRKDPELVRVFLQAMQLKTVRE